MTRETPCDLPTPVDVLGEVLHPLRLSGTLYCRAELSAPWGVDVPPLDGLMTVQIVTSGSCWLEIDGLAPRRLAQGSLTLIPHGTPHRLRSAPGVAVAPLFALPVEQVSERYEIMRYGAGGEITHVTYAVVQLDHVAARRLLAQLPRVLHVDAWDDDDASWLHSTLRLISREALALRPGGETVLTRLADILVIQAIRAWLDSAPEARQGWLAALRDGQIGRALAAIHRAPQRDWTVATLAREAGMSRSAFSARFTELVGESAVRYLTNWRMQLAHAHLQQHPEPNAAVARRFGYESEAAFCRAFKRTFGVSPGSVRHAPGTPSGGPGTPPGAMLPGAPADPAAGVPQV
ncbi:AraC family transcriptional regulator [Micromonospora echinofusca]|uniref:Helix-turn-helix domain-containing protein n=1 Tax=Micromonospora echinofusca TaxID=47858 RepID=A0ABS3VSH5_MICEH|nr:AraC family transcriptional regulator [Micromonospora echinofusca]MBO4207318.1 helix-turn-helix domain-containing protein [Micromonospora echinofusca]